MLILVWLETPLCRMEMILSGRTTMKASSVENHINHGCVLKGSRSRR